MTSKRSKRPSREPLYNAYRITSPAHEAKIVFAAGTWSAVGMLLRWHFANGIGEVPFAIDPLWATQQAGIARKHIHEARAACRQPGIGVCYRADVGWGIGGPDDERDDCG
ncbi:MAG TPA: hypothetical protein VF680_01730 [Allosphingosinicella sp.]|jgi:hypothetical protein